MRLSAGSKCLLQGIRCSQQKNCKNFQYINSSQTAKGKFVKTTSEVLKVKTIAQPQGVDYSKSYSIRIYKIYSYSENKNNYFYISNKDYEIKDCEKIDIASEKASKIRKAALNKDFVVDGERFKLVNVFKHFISKDSLS